ncbi:uncharacterized protein LOC134682593, partial [Mytilus trossulus]|uniref:uncharacterized protein LOC134682593 n=1 Tax=Mytilus trossulus TaxID=6551 RepID=UPI00300743AB
MDSLTRTLAAILITVHAFTVAKRMNGFQLYVTNTSNIPPDGYLCYADGDPGFPNITQTIPCSQLGKYVIYYDELGSDEGSSIPGPIVELCYNETKGAVHSLDCIALEMTDGFWGILGGCPKGYWGSDCHKYCPKNCVEQHCYLENGSCVL